MLCFISQVSCPLLSLLTLRFFVCVVLLLLLFLVFVVVFVYNSFNNCKVHKCYINIQQLLVKCLDEVMNKLKTNAVHKVFVYKGKTRTYMHSTPRQQDSRLYSETKFKWVSVFAFMLSRMKSKTGTKRKSGIMLFKTNRRENSPAHSPL